MKLLNVVNTLTVASAQEWWTTAAPKAYQCALDFVPRDLLTRASQYQQAFLNALTKENPDYWGSYYGGASYTAKCQLTSQAAEPTTTIRETSTAIFTIAQGHGPEVASEPTTTLTRTQLVTRTLPPSGSSTQVAKSTTTVTVTRPYDDASSIPYAVTTSPHTMIGTPIAFTSFDGSIYPETELPSVTTLTLTLFTRTPIPDTHIYTTHWANTSRLYPTRYTNTTATSAASTRGPHYLNTTSAPAVTTVPYTSTPINYNSTRSITVTETVTIPTESKKQSANPTSFVTVTYTVVGGSTLGLPTSTASEPATTLNAALNTNLPTGGWDSAIGSNPFGSNPFGSNPFGTDPLGAKDKRKAEDPSSAQTATWSTITL